MWYTSDGLDDIPADSRSLCVAFANLMRKNGDDCDPETVYALLHTDDHPLLTWQSLDRMPGFQLTESHDDNSTPQGEQVVVRLRHFQDRALVDRYCMLLDADAQTVIDLDGEAKPLQTYGMAYGWASYRYSTAEELAMELSPAVQEADPAKTYKLLPHETFWQVQRRFNIPAAELLEHNGYDKAEDVPPEATLRLPLARELPKTDGIQYHDLPTPQEFHILHPGARKVGFANATKMEHFHQVGPTTRTGAPFTAVREALIPVEGLDGQRVRVLMDANAVRLNQCIGYLHTHLGEGAYAVPADEEPSTSVIPPAPDPITPVVATPAQPVHPYAELAHALQQANVQPVQQRQAPVMDIHRIHAQRAALQPVQAPHVQAEDDSLFIYPLAERSVPAIDPKTGKRTHAHRDWDEKYITTPLAAIITLPHRLKRKNKRSK